jgi:hypothetical protein
MNFLRKNIFYVALLGVVLAALVIVMLIIPEANMAAKTQLLSSIESLRKSPPINEASIKAEQDRIARTASQVNGVINLCIEHNRKDFKVLDYPRTNTPIFPFHKDVYDKNLAEIYGLTDLYLATLDKMKSTLRPTTPPTDVDLFKETKRQEQMLRLAGTTGTAAPTTPPGMPGYPPMGMGGPGAALDFNSPAGSTVRMQSALGGAIYVPQSALDVYFTRPMQDVPPAQMWEMHLNLAVHNEIFSAIGSTIDLVLQGTGGPAKEAIVPNSPVKMLYKVLIDKSYVTTGGPTAAAASAAPAAAPGGGAMFIPPEALAGGGATFIPPEARGGGMNMGPRAQGFGGGAMTSLTAVPTGPSLGDRTSNKDYDVIRYSFQVVMPVRYLPLLERKLMERNFNTVLNFDLSEVDPASPAFASCYFGSDPVMLVTIHAQLLLMTAWERGEWTIDKEGKKVEKYPPLMPTEVLKTLPVDALRPADSERISQPS